MTKLAHNKCCRCGHEWRDGPGVQARVRFDNNNLPSSRGEAKCPECFSLYWRWLNCEEWGLSPSRVAA